MTTPHAAAMTELNDADLPEAFVHILPSELKQMERREMSSEVASVAFTNVDTRERSVPLYTADQLRQAIKEYLARQEVVRREFRTVNAHGILTGWSPVGSTSYRGMETDPDYEVRSLIVKEELK